MARNSKNAAPVRTVARTNYLKDGSLPFDENAVLRDIQREFTRLQRVNKQTVRHAPNMLEKLLFSLRKLNDKAERAV